MIWFWVHSKCCISNALHSVECLQQLKGKILFMFWESHSRTALRDAFFTVVKVLSHLRCVCFLVSFLVFLPLIRYLPFRLFSSLFLTSTWLGRYFDSRGHEGFRMLMPSSLVVNVIIACILLLYEIISLIKDAIDLIYEVYVIDTIISRISASVGFT